MPVLFRDVETKSTLDLRSVGAWKYAGDPTTEVLCIAYAVDDAPVQSWTRRQPIPEVFHQAARDPAWLIVAHNDAFERAIEERLLAPRYGWPLVPIERHRCTMAMALANALPGALDGAAAALGLAIQKDAAGARLMRQMAKPRKPRKDEDPNAIHWLSDPVHLERLRIYCETDVAVERELFRHLPPLSDAEQQLWQLDAVINARGFAVDVPLAEAAQHIVEQSLTAINAEITELTDGRITSIAQVGKLTALLQEAGHDVKGVTKRSVAAVLAHNPADHIKRILELRRDGGKASAGKLETLLRSVDGGRLHGTLKFHGAATGRWSGSGFQPHNLARAQPADPDAAIAAILSGNLDRVAAIGSALDVVASLSRSMIIAASGMTLISADYSAIESRVLAWLAGEAWKLDTYRKFDATGEPSYEPYCVTASRILRRPVTPEQEDDRQLGKLFDLAFGYGGALGAFRRITDADYSDGDVDQFKTQWRAAHPAIVRYWGDLHRALLRAVRTKAPVDFKNLRAEMRDGNLYLRLPSGRELVYPQARIEPGQYSDEIIFMDNALGGWKEARGWHGIFTENVVSGICRDLLAAAMPKLEATGYPITLHVHDEIVAEVPEDFGSADEFARLMVELPPWAAGLPLVAKGSRRQRYAKAKSAPVPSEELPRAGALIASDLTVVPIIDAPPLVPAEIETPQSIHITIFRDRAAQSLKTKNLTLPELRDLVLSTTAADKYALPLLKLARFGSARTGKNCLRSDANVVTIGGVEGDYDDKIVAFDAAVAALQAAGLQALVFTSPNYRTDAPKWRVLLPTSTELPPAERAVLMGRLNGVLGGVLAGESFVLSQPFYFGSVNNNPDHRAVLIDGDFIDRRPDLDAGALGKQGKAEDDYIPDEDCIADITSGADFHTSMLTLSSRWAAQGIDADEAVERLEYLMDATTAPRGDRWKERRADIRRTVASAMAKFAPNDTAPNGGSEYEAMLKGAKAVIREAAAAPPPPLPPGLILTLAQWAVRDLPAPDYLLGEMLSTTTRMLLAADTGLGKTLFSIAAGMRIAAGIEFLHWPGCGAARRVLYIDGEMSNRRLKQCLAEEAARLGLMPPTFFALSCEDVPGLSPLNTKAGQRTIEAIIREHCGDADLIIFDNIMALISGNHAEEDGWTQTLPWIRDLTRRAIGQLWIHHTGHDTSRQYGTKTREWQMDTYAQLDAMKRADTDISFLLTFRKARERNPGNRWQFTDANIALIANQWLGVTGGGSHRDKLSPEAKKYFDYLLMLVSVEQPQTTLEQWFQVCVARGMGSATPDKHRFHKYKRELIAKNWIDADETSVWLKG